MITPEPNFLALRLRLSALRKAKGLTYDDLHEASGVSRRSLVRMESGEQRGSIASWYRVAHALGVSFGELTAALDEPGSPPRAS